MVVSSDPEAAKCSAGRRPEGSQPRACGVPRCFASGRLAPGTLARLAVLALPFAMSLASQDLISLRLDESGEPVLPQGWSIETAYVIDTIAGTGESGFDAGEGLAIESRFESPHGIAMDASGNTYVADHFNNRVRRIDGQGRISTIAGTGAKGSSGDGGPAIEAQLDLPGSIALDAAGNIYVVEIGGHRVRRIDDTGTISTIAGTGQAGSGGDGGPATAARLNIPTAVAVDASGNVYVGEYGGKRIRKIDAAGTITTYAGNGVAGDRGDGGPAVEAQLDFVAALAPGTDGSVYFSDLNTARVRRIDPSGTITTVAGTGVRGWSGDGGPASEARIDLPSGLALDAAGNLYVTEYLAGRVRKVSPRGAITTIAGIGEEGSTPDHGLAIDAGLSGPIAIAVDGAGTLFLTEALGQRVRTLRPAAHQAQLRLLLGSSGDQVLLTVAEDGVVMLAGQPLSNRHEVTARNGKRYSISQTADGSIVGVYLPDRQSVALGEGKSVSLWNGEDGVWRIGIDDVRNGYRYVSDGEDYLLEWTGSRWRRAEYTIRTVAGTIDVAEGIAATSARLFDPHDVAIDSDGNVYVTDSFNHRVRKIDMSGTITTVAGTGERGFAGDGGLATEAEFDTPKGIAVNHLGEIYVVDSGNRRVRRIDPAGGISSVAIRSRLLQPHGIDVDAAGNLFVSNESVRDHVVWRISPDGTGTILAGMPRTRRGFADGATAQEARLNYPRGLALDAAGNVYVADRLNHRVRKIDLSGAVTTIAGTGQRGHAGDGGPAVEAEISSPSGVDVDAEGNVYVSDTTNSRIRRINAEGIIDTIAGTSRQGFLGDGGPAEEASIFHPMGIAVNRSGEVFFAETGNDRIRKIDSSGLISTLAGSGIEYASRDGGPAALAQFRSPADIAVDSVGNAYVADANQIRKIGPDGMISAIAGTGEYGFSGDGGPAAEARLALPTALAVDSAGNLYAGLGNRIRRIDTAGRIATIAGTGTRGFSGDGGPATEARIEQPRSIAVDSLGNIYFAEYFGHRVRRVDIEGVITTFAGTGQPDRTEEFGYVVSTGASASEYSPQPGGVAPAARARLTSPFGVAVDREDSVYIADRGNRSIAEARIGKILASSADRAITPLPLREAPTFSTDFAVDADGNIFLTNNGAVLKYSADGRVSRIAGGGQARSAGPGEPAAGVGIGRTLHIAPDSLGNLWVADRSSRRIRVLEPVP